MEPKVIFEDKSILVLDKPAGWVVNDAETTKDVKTIQGWIAKNFDFETAISRGFRSGIVHRLDKETSGILLIAKTIIAFENLQTQFKNRVVEKKYIALAHGKVEPEGGIIKAPIGRLPWNRRRFGVLVGGRESETNYKRIMIYGLRIMDKKEEFSLLGLFPKTGRTHQIRIHLKYIGHPIVSDEFYAGRKTARNDRKWCPRLFLHASEISFKHPESRGTLSLKSDAPEDLKEVLVRLEKYKTPRFGR